MEANVGKLEETKEKEKYEGKEKKEEEEEDTKIKRNIGGRR